MAGDWIGFRGGEHHGVASAEGLPVTWSDNENILWKHELPGLGSSSPIVVGDRLVVTCYSGYAESIDEPGEMDNLRRHIVCLDKTSGKVFWTKTIEPVLPESRYSSGKRFKNTAMLRVHPLLTANDSTCSSEKPAFIASI